MRKYNRKVTKSKPRSPKLFFLSVAFLFFIILVYCFVKVWTIDKFIFVNNPSDGDVEVLVIDSKDDNHIKYVFDGDSEVESSDGYGKYKLSSLWKLSEKDQKSGKLVADTIRKNYALPVFLWKNGAKSNLSFFQLIKLRFVKSEERKFTFSETVNFNDAYFTEHVKNIEVIDMSGELGLIDDVSKVIEVMGGKITINSKGYDKELDCTISSKDQKVIEYVNKIFECSIAGVQDSSVDLSIKLGSKFAERF